MPNARPRDARDSMMTALSLDSQDIECHHYAIDYIMEVISMIRTQVQLTEEQIALIKQVAAERNMSMSEVIRHGMDRFLRQSLTIDRTERVRRALEVTGRFRSGRTDVSQRHDEYLAEAYAP